jgi:hypothetical protein
LPGKVPKVARFVCVCGEREGGREREREENGVCKQMWEARASEGGRCESEGGGGSETSRTAEKSVPIDASV